MQGSLDLVESVVRLYDVGRVRDLEEDQEDGGDEEEDQPDFSDMQDDDDENDCKFFDEILILSRLDLVRDVRKR